MADYFDKLKEKGRMLDEGINNISKIWSAPHIHIGGHIRFTETDENTEDLKETSKAKLATETILKSCIELQESIQKDVLENETNLAEMRQFVNDSKSMCDDLIQQCSDIETLFIENGYIPIKELANLSPETENNTTLNNFQYPSVESTPYIPWKSKLKTFDASTPAEMRKKHEYLQNNYETPLAERFRLSRITSFRQSPQEPILSRYGNEL